VIHKTCPRCAERVLRDAAACKHCQYEFTEGEMSEIAALKARESEEARRGAAAMGIGCLGILALALVGGLLKECRTGTNTPTQVLSPTTPRRASQSETKQEGASSGRDRNERARRASRAAISSKPANIVFRDGRIICPRVARAAIAERADGLQLLRTFASARGYSEGDFNALVQVCTLHMRAARERGERAW
jgi:hypothetical protein